MRAELAALVSSRICHDLISPIGAIGNGVELLGMSDTPPPPEMSLISDSVDNASARIRFFRVAFGPAPEGHTIDRGDIVSTLLGCEKAGRFTYRWLVEGPLPRSKTRIAFLLIQCAETAMPRGGDIAIISDADGWRLDACGPKIADTAGLWSKLQHMDDVTDLTAAQVHFALLPDALAQAGLRLETVMSDTTISVRF